MGACIGEKHFTLNKKDGGFDSTFSINPEELKQLVKFCRISKNSIGKPSFKPTKSEKLIFKDRRSLYVVRDTKQGEFLTKENIKSIRPGYGMLPKYISNILGKKQDLKYREPLNEDMFSKQIIYFPKLICDI